MTKNRSIKLRPSNQTHTRKYDFPNMLLCNARSLCNKLDDLEDVINDHHVQVAAITETWFNDNNSWLMNIQGFTLYNRPRPEGRGGGVAIYVSSTLESCLAKDIEFHDSEETLWVILKPKYLPRDTSVIACCVVYIPPASNNVNFIIDTIIASSDTIRNKYPDAKLFIMGDFNRAKLDRLSRLLQLKQFVKKPTRGSVSLDLIFSDITKSIYSEADIIPPLASSDHAMVLLKPMTQMKIHQPVSFKRRPLPRSSIDAFGRWITTFDWRYVCTSNDPQRISTSIESVVRQRLDLVAPVKSYRKRLTDKIWYNPQLQKLKKSRDDCFKRSGKSSEYKKLRNKFNRNCKKAKANFYNKQLVTTNASNHKKWHTHVKRAARMTRNSFKLPSSNSHLPGCDIINNYFSEICRSLPALDNKQLAAVLPSQKPLPTISEIDVYHSLKSINSTKSTAHNDLPPKIIKEFAAELAQPLCHLFNASLQSGVVPDSFKIATVVPVPKKAPLERLSDLRPISLTPIFARVLEYFVCEWIKEDISDSLDLRQFGNIPKTSSTHYLVSLIDSILKHLEQPGNVTDLCLFDFSKAFDRVCHTTAVTKLLRLGMRPALLPWISSFLQGRKQQVLYDNTLSALAELSCGLPQGTRLGPIIFIALINDCFKEVESRWKYVDDLSVTSNHSISTHSTLQQRIDSLSAWSDANCMKLNSEKTQIIKFNFNKRQALVSTPLKMDNCTFEPVQAVKLLGVWITSDLRWSLHVETITNKASQRLYLLSRLKACGIKADHLLKVYKEFVRPVLEYAAPLWHPALPTCLSAQIESIQRRAVKIILFPECYTYNSGLDKLGIDTLHSRRENSFQRFAPSLLSNKRTSYLITRRPSEEYRRRLRSTSTLLEPKYRTERYRRSTVPSTIRFINSSTGIN